VVTQFACSEESLDVRGWGKVRLRDMREWWGYDGTMLRDGELYELGDEKIGELLVMKARKE
jgi:hypothetical protein